VFRLQNLINMPKIRIKGNIYFWNIISLLSRIFRIPSFSSHLYLNVDFWWLSTINRYIYWIPILMVCTNMTCGYPDNSPSVFLPPGTIPHVVLLQAWTTPLKSFCHRGQIPSLLYNRTEGGKSLVATLTVGELSGMGIVRDSTL